MKTVVMFSLLIIGLFVQFPVVQGVCRDCEPPRTCWHGLCINLGRNPVDEEGFISAASEDVPLSGRDSLKTPCTDICKAPNYCYHGICIHQGRNPVGEEVFIPSASEDVPLSGRDSLKTPCTDICKAPNYCYHGICIHQGRNQVGEEVFIPAANESDYTSGGVSAYDSLKTPCSDTCEPPNYCWRGICIHQARHLVDEEIFVPAASKGVFAFDGESCAKCHYPNQCIDRRCVPRGVERHLVNKCSYGADCGRGHWICFEGKCIKLQPEEEKNFY
uniref:Uncharacterized protein n=1 Tax=Caenorhabditis japonica TaxID=281687 RepID=A0A8R1I4Z7_CAEJA